MQYLKEIGEGILIAVLVIGILFSLRLQYEIWKRRDERPSEFD